MKKPIVSMGFFCARLVITSGVFAVLADLRMDHEKHVIGFCVLEKVKDGNQLIVVVLTRDLLGVAAAHFGRFLRLAGCC